MPEIVLTALNAKFIHSAFGLRYLYANLAELRSSAEILEFDINQRPVDIAERIVRRGPSIVGIGVYIWNAGQVRELLSLLKKIRPRLTIVLGGPEVSHETEQQELCRIADYVITGEADLEFARLCRELRTGTRPAERIIAAPLPTFVELKLPYDHYSDSDIAHRVVYVEASRGCPFSCEFCLSSLDVPVRQTELETFLDSIQSLLSRGARHLKFVDRTFNLNVNVARRILSFLRDRYQPGMLFHFEMVPDRFPSELRDLTASFPAGALQFEVGIQTFDPEVASRISRRQDYAKLEENLRFLRQHTGVHIHADLIFGLPGEDIESFAKGFDRLVRLGPHEIQVGMLKRLRGAPIARHDSEWGMVYNPHPPYEVLATKHLEFVVIQELRRFARYWDMVANSGSFVATTPLFWTPPSTDLASTGNSPFQGFLSFSNWLYARTGRTDSIAFSRLTVLIYEYLTGQVGISRDVVRAAIACDYERTGRRDMPPELTEGTRAKKEKAPVSLSLPKRQARHLQ